MVNKFVRSEKDRWSASLMAIPMYISDMLQIWGGEGRGEQRNYLVSLMFKPKTEPKWRRFIELKGIRPTNFFN